MVPALEQNGPTSFVTERTMIQDRKKQIKDMLLDQIDNIEAPPEYPNHEDFKRDWLNVVADVANEIIRQIS